MNVAYDLFCGAGGASVGLHRAGYTVIGFDAWDVACESHEANGYATHHVDLNSIDWSEYRTPDLLWASPPCQPFSAAGSHKGEGDDRDGMPAFLRAVDELRPPVVAMENVKGLTYQKHRWYLERCVKELQALGYDVAWRVLNAADFGVPQTRERLIVIARSDGRALRWPSATHAKEPGLLGEVPWVSMAEALGWGMTARPYPTIASARKSGGPDKEKVGGSGARAGLYAERDAGRWHFRAGNDDKATVRPVDQPAPTLISRKDPNGLSWVLNTGKDWKKGGTRLDAQQIPVDQPSPTVNAGGGGAGNWWFHERPLTTVAGDPRIWPPGHKINQADIAAGRTGKDRAGSEAIRVTEAEAALLQGFPPGYQFRGSRTAQFQQIGNAVPPALAHAVVEALR